MHCRSTTRERWWWWCFLRIAMVARRPSSSPSSSFLLLLPPPSPCSRLGRLLLLLPALSLSLAWVYSLKLAFVWTTTNYNVWPLFVFDFALFCNVWQESSKSVLFLNTQKCFGSSRKKRDNNNKKKKTKKKSALSPFMRCFVSCVCKKCTTHNTTETKK